MEVLANIGQRKGCAPIHPGSTMNIDHPISLAQESMHRLLELGKPIANIRIGAVGSIEALVSLGELVAKPSRRIKWIGTIDHMGNIASDLKDRGQIQPGSYQNPCMKPRRRISKRLIVHCSNMQTECKLTQRRALGGATLRDTQPSPSHGYGRSQTIPGERHRG